MKIQSITFKLLSLMIGAFIITGASVILVADFQLTRIIDRSQDAIYAEKQDVIWELLNRTDARLQKTGLVEAYGEDFKQSAVSSLRQAYYRGKDQLIYPFIIDKQARVIMHPVLVAGDSSLQKLKWIDQFFSSRSGNFIATYQGIRKWYIYREFSSWDWVIGYALPLEIKYKDAKALLNTLIMIISVLSVFVILVLSWILVRFTRPIVRLTHVATGIANGDLDHQIDLNSPDEVGTLARSLSHMRNAIKHQLKELNNEISERKQTEIALKKSEYRYRLIAENVADVIWTMDVDLNFTYISPSVYQLRGYTPEEAMKHTLDEMIPPDSIEKIMNLFSEKIILIRQGDSEGWTPAVFEIEQYCKDGTVIWTNNNARILSGPDGQPQSILGISRDISGQKRAQEMMIQSEKMMSVGGLAAGMAHEINNPLAGMIQTAEVMGRRLCDIEMPANQQAAREIGIHMDDIKAFMGKRGILHMVAAINNSGRRMADIVNNMLSFARKSNSTASSHSLADLIDKTLELATTDFDLKKHYDFKSIKITKQYDAEVPHIICEGAKIQQVLLNIFKNGAQAMQEAGTKMPAFIIRTDFKKNQKKVVIEIEDNGPGMDEKVRKRIFEPFFTTKPPGVGTGLGLSVSYFIIAENHCGEMAVKSQKGCGSTFVIHLPSEGK